MWIIWDGRMLNYGLAGRSQNVLFNLLLVYLIYTKIEYKKINIFYSRYSDPLLVLRPDLDSSQDLVKASQGIFQKNQKLTNL